MALKNENSSMPYALRMNGSYAAVTLHSRTLATGGVTLDMSTLDLATHTHGYYVGGASNYAGVQIPAVVMPVQEFTLERVKYELGYAYAEQINLDPIGGNGTGIPSALIGTWINEGMVYVDIVNHFADRDMAIVAAAIRGELAIWDIASNEELFINEVKAA